MFTLVSNSLADRNHIRYYYTHEILRGQQRFLQQQIDRTRRISIMIRDEPL